MGTRADFYAGRGAAAEWLGSIAWDGSPGEVGKQLPFQIAAESDWRASVAIFLAGREDGTMPEDGWPWPWNDSGLTDYVYAFDDGRVWAFGEVWFDPTQPEPEPRGWAPSVVFPDMKAIQKIAWGKRSGVMVLGQEPSP